MRAKKLIKTIRRLALAAPPPTEGPGIVPSYLDPDATGFDPDDLTGTDAAPLHPAIIAQARDLDFEYTRIADFVRTQVQTEWYVGSQKGPLGTLRSRAGNDADQAALLVALLRASSVPARFVAGTALVDIEDVGASLGLTQPSAIVRALNRAGVPHRPRSQGGSIRQIELDQVWVSARVPYSNVRGAAIESTGPAWLPFAPAIKRHIVARQASGDQVDTLFAQWSEALTIVRMHGLETLHVTLASTKSYNLISGGGAQFQQQGIDHRRFGRLHVDEACREVRRFLRGDFAQPEHG